MPFSNKPVAAKAEWNCRSGLIFLLLVEMHP
jgi:hypothetical protein